MAGIVAQYNEVPRIRQIVTNKIISPISGNNPADLGTVLLPNVRGQVRIVITVEDDPDLGNIKSFSAFSIVGGFGDYPNDPTQNFYSVDSLVENCTVTSPEPNVFVITTSPTVAGISPALGTSRQYRMEFSSKQSFGPTIQLIGGPLIGNNDLTVNMTKQVIIPDF